MSIFRALVVFAVAALCGCGNNTGPVESVASVSPSGLASAAIAQYDTNGDGALDENELKASPALALGKFDSNGDNKVDADELQSQFDRIFGGGAPMTNVSCKVHNGQRPLPGVTVTFEPESFMGDGFRTATGVTEGSGEATMAIADDQLAEGQRGTPLCQVGVYRVKLSGPGIPGSTIETGFIVDTSSRTGQSGDFDIAKMR
jgi:hypothetical protein